MHFDALCRCIEMPNKISGTTFIFRHIAVKCAFYSECELSISDSLSTEQTRDGVVTQETTLLKQEIRVSPSWLSIVADMCKSGFL